MARRLQEKLDAGKPPAEADASHLRPLLPYVGHLYLDELNDASFGFRRARELDGKSAKTIHLSLSAAQAILNLASSKWRTPDSNLPYPSNPPRLDLPSLKGKQRPPRPISWQEEGRLMAALPLHLLALVTFAINTGARDDVIVNFRWDWLREVPQFGLRIAVVPKEHVKGRVDRRILLLNSKAIAAIEAQRGRRPEYVFVSPQRVATVGPDIVHGLGPVETLNNTGWQTARERVGLAGVRIHDLRHTFANQLAAAGVAQDLMAALLWHTDNSVTQHYMGQQLRRLQSAVELIVEPPEDEDISILTLIDRPARPLGG